MAKVTFSKKSIINFNAGLLFVSVILMSGLAYWNIDQMRKNQDRVAHTHTVLRTLGGFLSSLKDAETAQRDYLITQKDSFLEPYHTALIKTRYQLREVQQLTLDNPQQQIRINHLMALTEAKVNELTQMIDLVGSNYEAARHMVMTGDGKIIMDGIRGQSEDLEKVEYRLLIEREQQCRRRYFVAITSVLGSALINLALLGFLLWISRRYILDRQRRILALERSQDALRESEECRRLFINHAPAALAMFDGDMCYIDASSRWISDYGLSPENFRGRSHYEVFPEIPDRWRELHRRGLAGEVLCCEEDPFVRANGSTQWIRWEIRPWYKTAEVVGGIVIFSEEITERKLAENMLRESERQLRESDAHFRQLAEFIPNLGWIAKPDGWVFWYNSRWYEYTGTTPEQMEGWGWQCVHDPLVLPKVIERWREAIATRQPLEMRFPLCGKDGNFRMFLTRVLPLFGENGEIRFWIGSNTDIDEIQRIEDELKHAKDEADCANVAKSQFLANMSHEIRTPMNAIMGMTDLVLMTELTDIQRRNLDFVKAGSRRLLNLINDILDLSRIEAGNMVLSLSEFKPTQLIQENVIPFKTVIGDKPITLEYLLEDGLPEVLIGDPLRLHQVLTNLINNAIKFTESGTITLIVKTVIRTEKSIMLKFSVTDTGLGIPANKLDQLFIYFSQLDSSITKKYGGSGLGLAISAALVREMGGEIGVESELGKGSTFHFTANFILPGS